ncbi:MAG: DNA-processing protein DprA [Proteobacteria bacterium]|nr:DNA-processing protein DprA [Pseudomonadota bacterium]
MDIAKEFFACLALKHAEKIGPKTHKALLEAYDTAFEAVQDARGWQGRKLARADQVKLFLAETWRPKAEFEYKAARIKKMNVLTWGDPRYPTKLRNIPDPPLALYYVGDLSLLKNPSLAVVGARKCSEYGLKLTRTISEQLSHMGLTIVSGLAMGIDREAHQGGLAGIGSSIAVVGAGLDHPYPIENMDVRRALENRGLVLSEFAAGVIPEPNNFPFRNRIISGLSLGVLVAEAANKSGSLITARLAGEQGREVFALPGPLGQPTFVGCHTLLKQGACLVESSEDILRELAFAIDSEIELPSRAPLSKPKPGEPEPVELPQPQAQPRSGPALPQGLEPDEATLFTCLKPVERMHIDVLCRTLDWDSARVSQTLLMLEIKGMIRQWPGMTYTHI